MPEHASAGHGRAQPPVATVPRTPPSVPDHELLRCIGRGSYGDVWLARNVVGTLRAVKIVYRDAFADARPYEREFQGMQKFEPLSRTHPGLVNLLQIGLNEAAGCFYYVMELADDASEPVISNQCSVISPPLPGASNVSSRPATSTDSLNTDSLITDYSPRTLASDLRAAGRLPFAQCLRTALALADALEHLHRHGLIHRDIKPSNIIFVNGAAKLADIGLVTETGAGKSWVGTEGFMPPEGPGTAQADIFSLGKVLYEISTGKDRQRFPEPLTALGELPDHADWLEFNEVVAKACEGDPKRHYASSSEMLKDLRLLQVGESVRQYHALRRQLSRLKRGVIPAAVVIIVGLVFWQLYQRAATQGARRQLLLNEVQMARQGARTNGWFDASWEKLGEIARLKPGADDARTQAAACLSGLDARLVDARTNAGAFSLAFSPDGQTLLCAGVTDKTGTNAARLWRVRPLQNPNGIPPSSPGLAQRAYPGELASDAPTPTGLRQGRDATGRNPVGVENHSTTTTQGSSSLATLGFEPESRWDSTNTTPGPTNAPSVSHSSFDIRHSEFHTLPVFGDAVAAWKFDGTTNGVPVLFQPGDSNNFVLREAATGRVLRDFPLAGNPFQGNENHPVLALSPDARYAAASVESRAGVPPALQGRFAVWDTATGEPLLQLDEPASALAFSPDGRALAVGDSEGRVRVFALPEREPERGLAVRSGNELEPASNSSTNSQSDPLRIANPRPVALLAEFPSARVRINCFAFTRDPIVPRAGPLTNAWWLAVGDAGGTIRIWRTATQEPLNTCRGSAHDILALAFYPDGVMLASGGRREVRLWDPVNGGEPLMRLLNQNEANVFLDYVRGVAFTADGSRLALSSEGKWHVPSVNLWEIQPHRGVQTLRGLASFVTRVWISPDGQWLAALANNWQVAVWDVTSGRLWRIFETPQGETADNAGLAFHPNGTCLAFSAGTNTAVWDFKTGSVTPLWHLPWGYGDDLAFDGSGQLWLMRRESLRGRERPMPWRLRLLDTSAAGTIRLMQTDTNEWHPTWFSVIPQHGCLLVAGAGPSNAFWRARCLDWRTGVTRWEQQNGPDEHGISIDPGRNFVVHCAGKDSLLRALPDGKPEAQLPYGWFTGPGGDVFGFVVGHGVQLWFGRNKNSPAVMLASDFRASASYSSAYRPAFSHDAARLAWGTDAGVVLVAELSEICSRLNQLNLDAGGL